MCVINKNMRRQNIRVTREWLTFSNFSPATGRSVGGPGRAGGRASSSGLFLRLWSQKWWGYGSSLGLQQPCQVDAGRIRFSSTLAALAHCDKGFNFNILRSKLRGYWIWIPLLRRSKTITPTARRKLSRYRQEDMKTVSESNRLFSRPPWQSRDPAPG